MLMKDNVIFKIKIHTYWFVTILCFKIKENLPINDIKTYWVLLVRYKISWVVEFAN